MWLLRSSQTTLIKLKIVVLLMIKNIVMHKYTLTWKKQWTQKIIN